MRVLMIEDDELLCKSLQLQLETENIHVDICHNGEDGLFLIRDQIHDVILLDRMLPLMNGIDVLKQMRREGLSTPVILITALGELADKIQGLDCGADDYIVKPFAVEELMARIRSIIRRPVRWEPGTFQAFSDIRYDSEQKILTSPQGTCTLSKREGDLLEFFLKNPGQILPRSLILSRVWGPDSDIEEGNLDNYIHFLRRRLKGIHSQIVLKTIRGVGYRLEENHV